MPMIKHGVLLLLKHNFSRVAAKLMGLAAALFFTVSFFSCKSAQQELPHIDILKLIDQDAPFFVYIPVEQNQQFVEYTISKMGGLSQDNAKTIASRSKNIAISTDDKTGTCIAIEGSFPAFGIKSALSEKNGWTVSQTENTVFPFSYFVNPKVNLQTASPVPTLFLASNDIKTMLKRYNDEAFGIVTPEENVKVSLNVKVNEFNPYDYDLPGFEKPQVQEQPAKASTEEIFKYLLDNNDTDIKFYSNNPSRILKTFLGKAVGLGINSLKGTLQPSRTEKVFNVKLELQLSQPSMTKAAVKMLKLALFPIPAKIVAAGNGVISISDVSLTYNQLIQMIVQ